MTTIYTSDQRREYDRLISFTDRLMRVNRPRACKAKAPGITGNVAVWATAVMY